MSDEVLISKLSTCLEHIDAVSSYYLLLKQNSDSKKNDSALYYDAIIMRLQALGESFKRLVKKYPNIQEQLNYQDLNHLIRFRDYISHHYEQIESEVIRDICEQKLPVLKVKTEELITNLSKV